MKKQVNSELNVPIRYEVLDARDMKGIGNDSIDVVLDKATSDALYVRSNGDWSDISTVASEIHRILKSKG